MTCLVCKGKGTYEVVSLPSGARRIESCAACRPNDSEGTAASHDKGGEICTDEQCADGNHRCAMDDTDREVLGWNLALQAAADWFESAPIPDAFAVRDRLLAMQQPERRGPTPEATKTFAAIHRNRHLFTVEAVAAAITKALDKKDTP